MPDLDQQACRGRQQRLVTAMHELGAELAVVTRMESVQWLTGARVGPLFCACAALDAGGRLTLVLPSRKLETPAAADGVVAYEEKWLSTMRDASDQRSASVAALLSAIGPVPRRVAYEATDGGALLAAGEHRADIAWQDIEWLDIDATLFHLRRRKDADELALLRRANDANRVMYEVARERVAPGLNELDLYSALHTAAVKELGEPLTYFGQDFRAGARGGPPRDRVAADGELWVLDLGVGLRGYHSDNARTLAVNGAPTDAQSHAWELIAAVFPMIESSVRPGVSCREVFATAEAMLAEAKPWVFNHHLGHGVGLAPHEGPHLNPNWDDTFAVGDFFTVEPGLYHDDLRQGIRLEQNYVVTETGVELLTDWPLGL